MIYTVTLNPAIDYVVQLPQLQTGAINRNQAEAVQFGGKGINVSGMLQNLGVENIALGFVAGFTGEGLEKGLRDLGMQTDFVHLSQGLTRINVKVKADEETEINGIGPTILPTDMQALTKKLNGLRAGDHLVLSGSVPSCLGADSYEKLLAAVADKAVLVTVDATGDLLKNTLKYKPFLIKPNNHELEELFGMRLQSDAAIADCGRRLQKMGARNVLISLAGDGAILLDETGAYHRTACPKGQVVNSVAAGDSMVAGFLAGYLKTGEYAYALKLGTAAGSATAFSLGLGEKELIDKLLEELQNGTV